MARKASLKKEIAAVENAGKKAAKGAGKVAGKAWKLADIAAEKINMPIGLTPKGTRCRGGLR